MAEKTKTTKATKAAEAAIKIIKRLGKAEMPAIFRTRVTDTHVILSGCMPSGREGDWRRKYTSDGKIGRWSLRPYSEASLAARAKNKKAVAVIEQHQQHDDKQRRAAIYQAAKRVNAARAKMREEGLIK